jgi:hypothetical protein
VALKCLYCTAEISSSALGNGRQRIYRAGESLYHCLDEADIYLFIYLFEIWDTWVAPNSAPTRATAQCEMGVPDVLVENHRGSGSIGAGGEMNLLD